MKTNKLFADIKRDLIVYILLMVLSIVLSVSFVTIVSKPRNETTLTIFMGTYTTNIENFKRELEKEKPNYLKEINIRCFSPSSKNYTYAYRSIGLKGADIIALPFSKIDSQTVVDFYAKITNEYIEKYFENYDVLTISNSVYGVKIHEKGQANGEFLSFYDVESNDDDYYLFYKKNSLHIGDITSSKYETAFILSKVFR